MAHISGYRITYVSEPENPWTVEIRCYGADDDVFPIGHIRFYEDPATIPPNGWIDHPEGIPIVNFPLKRFGHVVGILRDESDVDLGRWTGAGWGLATGPEPTGALKPRP